MSKAELKLLKQLAYEVSKTVILLEHCIALGLNPLAGPRKPSKRPRATTTA